MLRLEAGDFCPQKVKENISKSYKYSVCTDITKNATQWFGNDVKKAFNILYETDSSKEAEEERKREFNFHDNEFDQITVIFKNGNAISIYGPEGIRVSQFKQNWS